MGRLSLEIKNGNLGWRGRKMGIGWCKKTKKRTTVHTINDQCTDNPGTTFKTRPQE